MTLTPQTPQATTDTWLELHLLGPFDARLRGRPLAPLRSQKVAALLALLAVRPGRAVERDWLTRVLWPESIAPRAAYNLRRALSDLRSALREDADRVGTPTAHTIRLEPEGVQVDVALFDEMVRQRHDPAALETAVNLYRGEFLEGVELGDWVNAERDGRREAFRAALERLAELSAEQGDTGQAVVHLNRLLAEDPTRESACMALMRACADRGDYAGAIQAYRTLRSALLDHNIEMSRELSALYQEVCDRSLTFKSAVTPPRRLPTPSPPAPPPSPAPSTTPAAGPESDEGRSGGLPPGGAVPLQSPYYLERPADTLFFEALTRGDSTVLIKGPRQIGKTSLLARGLHLLRGSGCRVVTTDLQKLDGTQMASSGTLFAALADHIADELDLEFRPTPEFGWRPEAGPNDNFERFLRRHVLKRDRPRFAWAIDEADRLFPMHYGSEVFALMRSWHNERSLDPEGPWGRLTLIITYATEAHLFISDLNQSPFNVGTRVPLEDFTAEQVADLNRRYGEPLRASEDLERFRRLVGGHPFLVQSGLHALANGMRGTAPVTLADLEESGRRLEAGVGSFSDHLRRLRHSLSRDPDLCAALRVVLAANRSGGSASPPISLDAFYRLRASGVVVGDAPENARPRCALYADFLTAYPPEPAGTASEAPTPSGGSA